MIEESCNSLYVLSPSCSEVSDYVSGYVPRTSANISDGFGNKTLLENSEECQSTYHQSPKGYFHTSIFQAKSWQKHQKHPFLKKIPAEKKKCMPPGETEKGVPLRRLVPEVCFSVGREVLCTEHSADNCEVECLEEIDINMITKDLFGT